MSSHATSAPSAVGPASGELLRETKASNAGPDFTTKSMKLIEAFEILQKNLPAEGNTCTVGLVCGFNPLHFQTLLAAHLQVFRPHCGTEIQTGLYGDFWGNLDRLEKTNRDASIVLLEWPDFDSRLGIRSLGGWTPAAFTDILGNVKARASQFLRAIQRVSKNAPLVICFPTLPLPPISFTSGWQASVMDLELRASVSSLSIQVAQHPSVRVINPQRLDRLSPPGERLDVESELLAGFPYKLPHAAVVAELIGRLLQNPTPKKGLITDLDGTLWKGILGETGIEGVSWGLDHRSHMHGLYQQLLQALSAAGVLIGVASKNDSSLVEKAFQREDLILSRDAIFPMEAHWGPKSESVARILKTWNVAADAVVFIDDSPTELAEVKLSHPDVECILFPRRDYEAIYRLLERLRDFFGKSVILEEDAIRLKSIRRGNSHTEDDQNPGNSPSQFLEQAEAELTLSFSKYPLDPRALTLVNKTNQFNLNGARYTDASWTNYLKHRDTFLLLVAYKDKYGPLGKIAVLAGRQEAKKLFIDTWVMSCRAFSRCIEHRCLEELFARFGVDEVEFDFAATNRNSQLRAFLEQILDMPPTPGCRLEREKFFKKRPRDLLHRVREITD